MGDLFFSPASLQLAGALGIVVGGVQLLPSMQRRAAERGFSGGWLLPLCFVMLGALSLILGLMI